MSQRPHLKPGFEPNKRFGGILFPGDSTELFFIPEGKAFWHLREAHWTWNESAMPVDVVRNAMAEMHRLIDLSEYLRGEIKEELERLQQQRPKTPKDPLPNPAEPKVLNDAEVELIGSGATTLIFNGHGEIFWHQRGHQTPKVKVEDIPPEVGKEAFAGIARLASDIRWMFDHLPG